MLKEDYEKLRGEVSTDLSKLPLFRLAEGAALLAKLLEEQKIGQDSCSGNVASQEDILYVGGPPIESIDKETATRLLELGFVVFKEDFGFQFST